MTRGGRRIRDRSAGGGLERSDGLEMRFLGFARVGLLGHLGAFKSRRSKDVANGQSQKVANYVGGASVSAIRTTRGMHESAAR